MMGQRNKVRFLKNASVDLAFYIDKSNLYASIYHSMNFEFEQMLKENTLLICLGNFYDKYQRLSS